MGLRHAHFVAIGGTGMGSLAGMLRARGVRVTGSDREIYPPMSDALRRAGIEPTLGFHPEHVLRERPDLVVVGNAVRADNPEARAALEAGLRVASFPDALYELAMRGRHSVVVAGTHGKTTTTSLVATLLVEAGLDPSFLVGGIARNFEASFREGTGPHFVVEGDEYDTAFFDKTPKFLHYHARTLVLTSIEFDHGDIYRDLEDVCAAFAKLVADLPDDGVLVASWDDANVRRVVGESARVRCVPYALRAKDGIAWRAVDLEASTEGTRFRVLHEGRDRGLFFVPLHGEPNVANALAALAVASELGVPLERARAALPRFLGVRRRQELRGEERGVAVIDDFAHHPTEVRATLGALRARYPERPLVAVLEPRTNTSRRRVFQNDYASALEGADRVLVSIVPDGPIYSATGEVTERLSAEELAAELRGRGVEAEALAGADGIAEHLARTARPGDVVVLMSNGAFGNVWQKLLDRLRA